MKKKGGLSVIIIVLFVITIIVLYFISKDYDFGSLIIPFFLLSAIGIIFLKGSQIKKLFFLSFFINIIISAAFDFYFLSSNGTPFTKGGDEKTFYDFSVIIYENGIDGLGDLFLLIPYKAYLLILTGWMKLLGFIGVMEPTFPFNLRLLNDFAGGFIPVLSFKIFSKFLDTRQSRKFALYVLSFPLTIFYSVTLLRDLYVTIPFLLLILLTLNSRYNKMARFILGSLLVIFTYFIRPASALFIMSFPFAYLFFKNETTYIQKFKQWILVPLLFIGLILISFQFYNRDIDETHKSYIELSSSSASENSIGKKLVTSQNPGVKLFLPIYIAYSPIPPPVFTAINVSSVLISIGSVWWYFILPLFFLLLFRIFKEKNKFSNFVKASGATFAFALVGISLTSMDPRHIQFIYPIAVFGGMFYIKSYISEFKKIIPVYIFSFLIIFTLFLFIKGN